MLMLIAHWDSKMSRNVLLTLSLPDGPYVPMTNIIKDNFSGGKVQNIVIILMAVFYDSLRFHLIYLTLLPPEKCIFVWVPTIK